MYGPTRDEILTALNADQVVISSNPRLQPASDLFSDVRTATIHAGYRMLADWCESMDICDENIVAMLVMLETVPDAVMPLPDFRAAEMFELYGDSWRDRIWEISQGDERAADMITAGCGRIIGQWFDIPFTYWVNTVAEWVGHVWDHRPEDPPYYPPSDYPLDGPF